MLAVAETPHVAARGVVAQQQLPADDHAAAESRSECHAQQVAVAFLRSGGGQLCIDPRKRPDHGLAVGEEVAVVVDEDRDAEFHLEERPEGYAVAERREVGQVARR